MFHVIESRQPSSSSNLAPERDQELTLRHLFDARDQALNTHTSDPERRNCAYSPILEYHRVLKHGKDSPGLREELRENIITMLAEYFGVHGWTDHMKLVNGKMRSRHFPNEDFTDAIRRGINHRASLGSNDQKREIAELIGFEDINARLLSLPLGSKVFSLSPPSPSGDYPSKYIDEFFLYSNNGELLVHRRRTMVNFSLEDFEAFALAIDPAYFKGYIDNFPLDAWFLSHPLTSNSTIPQNRIEGYDPKKFEELRRCCAHQIEKLNDTYFQENFSWTENAKVFNQLLNHAIAIDHQLTNPRTIISGAFFMALHEAPTHQLPCGNLGPVKFGKSALLENSVTQFAVSNTENYETGTCQSCKKHGTVGKCTHKCWDCEDREHPNIHFDRN